MGLRTPKQYRESLRDGRTVYYRGERVPDVTTHEVIKIAVDHAAIDFELAEKAEHRELTVVSEEGDEYSRYYKLPRSSDDLLKRSALIELATAEGKTLVCLIKEIGTDALFALTRISKQMDRSLESAYHGRVQDYFKYCRDNDLALSVAQTDVKGDRGASPSAQTHGDYYVRIVDQNADGITVRGAKVHTSCTTNVNEVIVLPTRAMSEADKDYAVAFAVPVDTPGLKLISSPYGGTHKNVFEHPISAQHKMMETTTVFDDVFVPWERVFMAGESQWAGPLALGFVEYHRFTAVSYKLPLVDALIGAAQLLADYNGISKAAHVRDKFVHLISYAETVRGLTHLTAMRAQIDQDGIAAPDPLTTNMAKYHFAHNYHEAVAMVQDISGGLLVTSPGEEDWENPETSGYLEHYFGGKPGVPARDRQKAINMVRDLTASDYGGYQEVLAIHAEGSLEAEKLMILRAYKAQATLEYAKQLANLS